MAPFGPQNQYESIMGCKLPQVEPSPAFFPPESIQVEPLVEPEYVSLEPPVGAEAPPAPVIGKPQYGHDWTGNRPFTVRCCINLWSPY